MALTTDSEEKRRERERDSCRVLLDGGLVGELDGVVSFRSVAGFVLDASLLLVKG